MYHNPLFCQTYDNAIRWQPSERLDHLFEERCDRLAEVGVDHPAVIAAGSVLTYDGLDRGANQLARYLRQLGVRPGDRVGIMLRQSVETYATLLAILKANAAYVPLDPNFPSERLRFIAEDAGIEKIVTLSEYRDLLEGLPVEPVFIDLVADQIGGLDASRLSAAEKGEPQEQLCYIVYTSGSTGRPKGVAIEHPSICNFVRVAAEVYGYREEDRVYQGMTIAFDFSVEEIWVPLMAGATLVPGIADATLVGKDLADFLFANEVTALCCVPTLLATIDRELPSLRLLLVSGEACPHDLVVRWHRPGRTILNAYGPTEATVTATWTELSPDKPVTIGAPMPTYSIVILDEHENKVVPDGASGEICIAGIGLAKGYVNRADLTEKAFIPDFLGITNNPSGRIYRTGDLGRILEAGEIEYQGRIDTQVKVRGYRIELTEIESVLMEVPEVAQAVVSTWTAPEGSSKELVAYVTLKEGVAELPRDAIAELLRSRLPGYMIPSYLEQVGEIPMLPSHKADRKALPPPAGPRFVAGSVAYVAPRTETEEILAGALARVLNVERVSVRDNFFDDLGAHSLLMARFCSDVRQNSRLRNISMRAVYVHPTIEQLGEHLLAEAGDEPAAIVREEQHIPTSLAYYGCGTLQVLTYFGFGLLGLWLLIVGFRWTYAAVDDAPALYMRVVVALGVGLIGFSVLPIAAKWLLIGRWKAETFPVWSLRYYRFWLVRALIGTSPMAAFRGTPVYNAYLRLLGARIGSNVVIFSAMVPVTTDLFEVGDNTILSKDSIIVGHKAQGNRIHIGPIRIGADAFVGEASVLDIHTTMEDRTQLGHVSSLQSGQCVPAGKRYHGSPAIETAANYCKVEARHCSTLRRWLYPAIPVLPPLLLMPVFVGVLYRGFPYFYDFTGSASVDVSNPDRSLLVLALSFAIGSFVLFVLGLATGLLGVVVLPRLLNRFLKEDATYVLFGVRYFIFRLVAGASNSLAYNLIFGDSSAIVNYLRWIGWNLNKVVQSGSNFGTNHKHDNPFLCDIGSGTMVSDGLSMMNAIISNSSFRLSRTRIGDRNYLGNNIHYPHDGRTGDNVLLGTKAMIPIEGPVHENVGLLGSPCFVIPRTVSRDAELAASMDEATRARQLHRKNIHNLVTVVAWLFTNWVIGFAGLFAAYLAILAFPVYGLTALFVAGTIMAVIAVLYFVLSEWAGLGFKRLRPRTVPILHDYFWAHERHWKFAETPLQSLFRGTPLKNVISRLLGVKVGRKVFDDGAQFLEKTLIAIGDYANLNAAVTIQGHSLEEGVFKSDYIRIGKGCSIATAAFVHYGVDISDNTVIDPDSFLMKGEAPTPGSVWRGNPARQI